MRAFIAIELSEPIRDALAKTQTSLKYAGADVKWIGKDNIHLTLKFLGEISEDKAEQVATALDDITKETKPFDISLKDLGAFPAIDHPRVIWVGLDKGAKESTELAKKIDEALSKLGFQEESRPFAAHLTIGRVRSGLNRTALVEKMKSYQLSAISFQLIKSIALFKSTFTPKGPIYVKLHEAKLA